MGFDLITRMGYDGRGFTAGLNQSLGEARQASSKMSSLFANAFTGGPGAALGGIGGAFGINKLFGVLEGAAEKVSEKFSEAKIAARQMGIEVELAARIANITGATGTGPETAAIAMDHIAEALEKIRKGEPGFEKLIAHFRELGITAKDIETGTRQSVFLKIFGGLEGRTNISDATFASMKAIMGRGGDALIPAAQIGLDSAVANAGAPDQGQVRALANVAAINRELGANKQNLDVTLGTWWGATKSFFHLMFKVWDPGQTFRVMAEARDAARRISEQNEKLRAAQKGKNDKEASALSDKIIQANQHTADLIAAGDLDKDTEKRRRKSNQEEEKAKFEAMSPSQKRAYLSEKRAIATLGEADYNHLADEAKYEGDRELEEARYRNIAQMNHEAAVEAGKQLGELNRKHLPIKHDSLIDVGNFLGGSARDESHEALNQMNLNIQAIRARIENNNGPFEW